MARERYETTQDLENERRAFEYLERKFGLSIRKLTDNERLDGEVKKDGRVVAWMEFKRRTEPLSHFEGYGDIYVAKQKYDAGVKLARDTGAEFWFVVRTADCLVRYTWREGDDFTVRYGGRTVQTRDKLDVEDMVHIPISRYEKLASPKAKAQELPDGIKKLLDERLAVEPEQCEQCERRKVCIPTAKEMRQGTATMPYWCSQWEVGGLEGLVRMLGDDVEVKPKQDVKQSVKRKRGEVDPNQGSLL